MVDGNEKAIVTIVGRTDATGDAQQNMQLSQERAAAVRDELLAMGKIPANRVQTAWTGETMSAPITVCRRPATGLSISTSTDSKVI